LEIVENEALLVGTMSVMIRLEKASYLPALYRLTGMVNMGAAL
jgi:hypothetical protein